MGLWTHSELRAERLQPARGGRVRCWGRRLQAHAVRHTDTLRAASESERGGGAVTPLLISGRRASGLDGKTPKVVTGPERT